MKTLPSKLELYESFMEFFKFTMELVERADTQKNYLKFAATSAQITLELFLKYYFTEIGQVQNILKEKKGVKIDDYKDFSEILNYFYSTREWSYAAKHELRHLLEVRNDIVHKGLHGGWNEELAVIIVRIIFFIHATMWSAVGKGSLKWHHIPTSISQCNVWKKGADTFVDILVNLHNIDRITCLNCGEYTMIPGDIFALEGADTEEYLVCANCLTAIDIENTATLIRCYECEEFSYFIDRLNEQKDQLYVAGCSECGTRTWVRKCKSCHRFYHPSTVEEAEGSGYYFCSRDCLEIFEEEEAFQKKIEHKKPSKRTRRVKSRNRNVLDS